MIFLRAVPGGWIGTVPGFVAGILGCRWVAYGASPSKKILQFVYMDSGEDVDAVEEYQNAFQRTAVAVGDLVNVPVQLLAPAFVASRRLGTNTVLVGTVGGVPLRGGDSCVQVDVECYGEVLDIPLGHPCVRSVVRPSAIAWWGCGVFAVRVSKKVGI